MEFENIVTEDSMHIPLSVLSKATPRHLPEDQDVSRIINSLPFDLFAHSSSF